MKTFKGEVFCPDCGSNLALGIEKSIAGEPPKEHIFKELYLYCSNQNCPKQHQRQELPEA